jgi:simple sugar transport system ATP-binding protein
MSELLELRGIAKRFPGVVALDAVDFTVRSGEVHALLGENGAGKSTLIKVLTGVHPPDRGEIRLAGKLIRPASPRDAERAGISTVYQEVNLIPSLSVAENIGLGRQPGRWGFLNWRALRRHARDALARLEIECDVDAELGTLSVALQQMVAIARALDLQARLLVLDEPTASLDEKEIAELFAVVRRLREQQLGIVFVTHFLDQVYAISDRITVLRNGRLVGEFPAAGLPRLELVAKMLGRDLAETAAQARAAHAVHAGGPPLLTVRGLERKHAIHGLDFNVHRGEIVGLAGLLGSGRTETARLLFGIDRRERGTISLNGKSVRLRTPREAMTRGLAFSSEDRKTEGILPNLSVRENLIVALQAKRGGWRSLTRAEQDALCAQYIAALKIKTADAEVPVKNLSGGNQQKVLLARWLATQPELIVLDEPTRGIDVGAKAEIEQIVAKLRAEGVAVVFISSEIEEVARNSSRVVVLRERRKVGELSGDEIETSRLMRAMAGGPHSG